MDWTNDLSDFSSALDVVQVGAKAASLLYSATNNKPPQQQITVVEKVVERVVEVPKLVIPSALELEQGFLNKVATKQQWAVRMREHVENFEKNKRRVFNKLPTYGSKFEVLTMKGFCDDHVSEIESEMYHLKLSEAAKSRGRELVAYLRENSRLAQSTFDRS
jgi:hypothetical protein